jgi:hypothetical protein
VSSESPGHNTAPRFTVRKFNPNNQDKGASLIQNGSEFQEHTNLRSARAHAQRLAAGIDQPFQRYARAVKRYAMSNNLQSLFRAAHSNPYDETLHGAIADAIEEEHPGSPFPEMIRKHYGSLNPTGEGANNLWYPEFENSWDGTFPYTARLGEHGPFQLYLGHEHPGGGLQAWTPSNPDSNARWILHAIAQPRRGDFVGYTFETGHENAHEIPRMFPAAERYISPNRGRHSTMNPPPGAADLRGPFDYSEPAWRSREARDFEDQMDHLERMD